jgi:2-iminoacetate synthase
MSFYEIYSQYKCTANIFDSVQLRDVEKAISIEELGADDLLALLSPAAEDHLEVMASKAHEATLRYFGRAIQLYTPLYLSNYCENKCAYCGFSAANKIKR